MVSGKIGVKGSRGQGVKGSRGQGVKGSRGQGVKGSRERLYLLAGRCKPKETDINEIFQKEALYRKLKKYFLLL
jgi:hypothetical protein